MPERQKLLSAYNQSQKEDNYQFVVLATIVETEGSTFRQSGAKMLLFKDGGTFGSLTGSCMEQQLHEDAQLVFQNNIPRVVVLDSTDRNDHILGYGIGCAGKIKVFLEVLDPNMSKVDLYLRLGDPHQHLKMQIGLIYSTTKPNSRFFGKRILIDDGKLYVGTIAFNVSSHLTKIPEKITIGSDELLVFVEERHPLTRINIFGANIITEALAKFSVELGWKITILDHRKNALIPEKFPDVDSLVYIDQRTQIPQVQYSSNDFFVLLTQNFFADVEYLQQLIPNEPHYVGVLGSKKRTQLLSENLNIDLESLDFVSSPIGLDIAVKTPASIALSIVAEIQQKIKSDYQVEKVTNGFSSILHLEDNNFLII